ncbi:MAG: UDP-N-acetylmuramate dehydrogenase, partial [Moraxellaceae bacterium]|nr:UDP-N-acetylmuramate dehydrogenase [Moraxellaceae bacterium]
MQILENFSLQQSNTLGLPACARRYVEVFSEASAQQLLQSLTPSHLPLLVLGSGSNIVLAGDVDGLVLRPLLRGIHLLEQDNDRVIVEAMAGEGWHSFVRHTLTQGWYGLENLSLIPGTVGAAPVQNIGAYGVEISDVFHSLTAIHLATAEWREFSPAECAFSYRDSIFKQQPGQWLITRVRFSLSRRPQLRLDYGDIRNELAAAGIDTPSPLLVSDAVMAIRQRKLPDPAVLGNAGSFFKNPVVSAAVFDALKARFPGLVAYPQGSDFKLAAGWLIEQAGWKGRSLGRAGCYERQALVLVNHGGATGAELLALADAICRD